MDLIAIIAMVLGYGFLLTGFIVTLSIQFKNSK